MRLLMGLPGVGHAGRGVLHGCLMRSLPLLGRLNDIEVVLVLPAGIRVLRRVQNLLLSLQLLLEHYLGLLLVGTTTASLESLRVATRTPLTVSFVTGPGAAPVVLGGLVADDLMLQFEHVA